MTTLFRCTRCGRIVTVDTEKSDGCVPRCEEKLLEYLSMSDRRNVQWNVCGGLLEPASKGENDVPK
jgi:DNA-directed RNA polymerase subunit RPC12/RpoP